MWCQGGLFTCRCKGKGQRGVETCVRRPVAKGLSLVSGAPSGERATHSLANMGEDRANALADLADWCRMVQMPGCSILLVVHCVNTHRCQETPGLGSGRDGEAEAE